MKLFELGDQQPEKTAHLVLLALKERDPKNYKVRSVLPGHSASAGKCLAQIQLQVRLYTQSILQNQILCSFLEEALKREPQNPLLLLAKLRPTLPILQTTTSLNRGFEIAVASRMPSTASLPQKKHSSMLG